MKVGDFVANNLVSKQLESMAKTCTHDTPLTAALVDLSYLLKNSDISPEAGALLICSKHLSDIYRTLQDISRHVKPKDKKTAKKKNAKKK